VAISFKTKIEPTTQPINFTLIICPGEMKTCIHTNLLQTEPQRTSPQQLHPAQDSKRAEDHDTHPVCLLYEEMGWSSLD